MCIYSVYIYVYTYVYINYIFSHIVGSSYTRMILSWYNCVCIAHVVAMKVVYLTYDYACVDGRVRCRCSYLRAQLRVALESCLGGNGFESALSLDLAICVLGAYRDESLVQRNYVGLLF